MKRFVLLTVAFSLAYPAITQDDSTKLVASTRPGSEKVISDTRITIGEDLLSYEGSPESRSLRFGNRGIEILEMLEGHKVSVKRFDEESNEEIFSRSINTRQSDKRKGRTFFNGNWSGIEIGFNNFLTSDHSMVLPDDDYYLTLNSGKSMNVNINFAQVNIGLTRHIGLVSGLGFNMNNYFFEGNNTIVKSGNGIITPQYPEEGIVYEKSKLATRFLTAPLLLEMQLPTGKYHRVRVAAGPIGSIKLGSNTKTVYYWDGKQKVKEQGDFSLNMLRYGFTARAGYRDINLYGTYYMTPLFREGKGPDIHPFEVGLSFTIYR
ncbi:MAG: outer membrane beta-barrel protein [Bacteroidales bacterium]